jgi:hypothetical protein
LHRPGYHEEVEGEKALRDGELTVFPRRHELREGRGIPPAPGGPAYFFILLLLCLLSLLLLLRLLSLLLLLCFLLLLLYLLFKSFLQIFLSDKGIDRNAGIVEDVQWWR